MNGAMIIIKRYPNRKLYNTDSKRYVTLEQLADLIRSGSEVQILDHATGEDLTAVTLTQIIFEQEKKQGGYLPRSVLTGLIQSGGQTLANLRRALASPLDLFHHIDLEIIRRIDELVRTGTLTDEEGEHLEQMMITESTRSGAITGFSEAQIERVLAERDVPTQEDLKKLNENLEGLIAKLGELSEKSEELDSQ
jgi:polyhydroxyalkanoate synthesis repressor PhaR